MDPEFELQLGNFCNNRCCFCSSGQDTQDGHAGVVPLEDTLAALDEAHRNGLRKVTFLGGEPTLYDTFLPALKRAVSLDFDEIVIFTNGARGKDARWLNDVVSMGSFTWRFSIQGGNEETHDAVTGRKGSFARILHALEHLNRVGGQRISSNMCVNEHSFRSLPDLPSLAAKYNLVQICVDMVGASRTGVRSDAYLRSIMARYSDIAVFLERMLDGFEATAPRCEVNVTNVPICVLPRWAHVLSYGGEHTTTYTVDGEDNSGELRTRAFDKYAYQSSTHQHLSCCEECVFQTMCRGVQTKYLELHGEDEFSPVSREQLLAIDAGQHRLFTLLARPHIEPLTTTAPPRGWSLRPIQGNNRDGRLDIRCDHADGSIFLGFSPPGARGPHIDHWSPILITDKYEMRVMMMPGADNAPIGELAAWAQDTLSTVAAVEILRRSNWSSGRRPDRLTRARAQLARIVRAVPKTWELDGWKISKVETIASGLVLVFRRARRDRFELILTTNEDVTLPLVSAQFEIGDGTAMQDARAPIEALSRLLREVTRIQGAKEDVSNKQ